MENIQNDKVLLFDYKTLLIFKYLTTVKDSSVEDLIVYDFLIKFGCKEDIPFKFPDLYFSLNYLLCNINKEISPDWNKMVKSFKKFEKSTTTDTTDDVYKERFLNLKKLYSNVTDQERSKDLLIKKPFCFFTESSTSKFNSSILEGKETLEIFIHLVGNYVYYLCSKYSISNNMPTNSLHPKAMSKIIQNLSVVQAIEEFKIRSVLNSFFKFYKKLPNKTKMTMYENEAFIEVFLNIFSCQMNLDKNFLNRNKYIFKFLKNKLLFQTSIMLMNVNKNNKLLIKNISAILSTLLIDKSFNIIILMDIFDNSNIQIDKCRILIKKLLISIPENEAKEKYFNKVITSTFQFILYKGNKTDEVLAGLKILFTEIFNELVNEFKSDYSFVNILFKYIYSLFFRRLGYKLIINDENELKIESYTGNKYTYEYFTKKQVDYFKFLVENFDIMLKSNFKNLFEFYEDKIFILFFVLLTKLWQKNKVYYDNLNNSDFSFLQSFISLHFDNLDFPVLANKLIKFYLSTIFKPIKTLSNANRDYELEINFEEGKVIQLNCENLNFKEITERVSSCTYATQIQNSIENIFKIYPFKHPQVIKSILNMFIEGKIDFTYESLIEIEDYEQKLQESSNCFYTREEIDSVLASIVKVNNLYNIIKHKIFICAFTSSIESENINEILNTEDIFKFIVFLLKNKTEIDYTDSSDKITIEEICLNCLGAYLLKIKNESIKSVTMKKYVFELIPLIEELEEKYETAKEVTQMIKLYSKREDIQINKSKENKFCESFVITVNSILADLPRKSSNLDKSYLLNELAIELIKSLSDFRLHYNSINLDLEFVKNLFQELVKYLKIADIHLWKIAQKSLINLFEILLNFKEQHYIQFYFNLFKSHFKEFITKKNLIDKETISFENQTQIKFFELLEKIIKKNKIGCLIFCKQLTEMILELFDEYFKILDPTVVAGAMSIIAQLINYAGLEFYPYLSTFIRTALNHLNTSMYVEIKRSSAFLLFKIIQNCDFCHYQEFAKPIYTTIQIKLDKEKDKVTLFHLKRCMNIIKESVSNFYQDEETK